MSNFFDTTYQGNDINVSLPEFLNRNMPDFASLATNVQERIFQSDMAAAMRASMQSQPPQPVAASHNAIRQLPIVKVSREDLIDPCNRECCICLEGIQLGNSVLRLPCAHVYHPRCIQQWLTNHGNTCPVCRYELPVDNNQEYEAGRQERMRCRKPRFAQHELDRLSIAQLKQLLPPSSQTNRRFAERRDLVECLIQSGAVDLVATPEPVQYRLSELRKMSISRLKRTMSDAGVFFDAKEVVEKSDMIHIFTASGRLQLLDEEPEEEEEKDKDVKPAARPVVSGVTVETVPTDDAQFGRTVDEREDTSVLMEENMDFKPRCTRATETRQTESADDSSSVRLSENTATPLQGMDDFFDVYSLASDRPIRRKRRRHETGSVEHFEQTESQSEYTKTDEETMPDGSGGEHSPFNDQTENAASFAVANETSSEEDSTERPVGPDDVEPESTDNIATTSESSGNEDEETLAAVALDRRNISQLKALARAHSIDLSDCLERTEIICRLTSRLNIDELRPPRANVSVPPVLSHPLDSWGISEIRALAALSEVDLSNCQNREQMINMLNITAISRPHVANYFQTLAPLAQLSVPQLRAVARERQILVLDCIEKGDIIQRLVEQMRCNSVSET